MARELDLTWPYQASAALLRRRGRRSRSTRHTSAARRRSPSQSSPEREAAPTGISPANAEPSTTSLRAGRRGPPPADLRLRPSGAPPDSLAPACEPSGAAGGGERHQAPLPRRRSGARHERSRTQRSVGANARARHRLPRIACDLEAPNVASAYRWRGRRLMAGARKGGHFEILRTRVGRAEERRATELRARRRPVTGARGVARPALRCGLHRRASLVLRFLPTLRALWPRHVSGRP